MDTGSLFFPTHSLQEGRASPRISSSLEPSGNSRAAKWHTKPFKGRKGTQQHLYRFLHLHLQPLLQALGEKPSHWTHLHIPPPDKTPPWYRERQPELPAAKWAVNKHQPAQSTAFYGAAEAEASWNKPPQFCRLLITGCTHTPHWPCPMAPTVTQNWAGQPGQPSFR